MSMLLSLPVELRLQILSLIIKPDEYCDDRPPSVRDIQQLERYKSNGETDQPALILFFRNMDPWQFQRMATLTWPRSQSMYRVRTSSFRGRTMATTYACHNSKSFTDTINLLLLNNQLYTEAAKLFYGNMTLDFDTHVEAIVPLLSDMTPFSRSCVKSISLIKQALPYEKEYDRCEWTTAMQFLADPRNCIELNALQLGIVAGRPADDPAQHIPAYNDVELEALLHGDSMYWLREVLRIRMKRLDVYSVTEHCPPAYNSSAMADYIRFSANVDALALFLNDRLQSSSEEDVV